MTTIPLEGGHLALDFVNTMGGLHDDPPTPEEELFDGYHDFADLVRTARSDLRAAVGRTPRGREA